MKRENDVILRDSILGTGKEISNNCLWIIFLEIYFTSSEILDINEREKPVIFILWFLSSISYINICRL
jgi:hypothetical protein